MAGAVALTAGIAQAQLKIAFVYVTHVGDAGWTYQHHLGRMAMEKALGNKIKVTTVGPVKEGADAQHFVSMWEVASGVHFVCAFILQTLQLV